MDHHNTRAWCDSETYACRANHYNWTVPHPMWTVSAQNRILSKDEVDNQMHAPQDNDPDSGSLRTWCDSTKNDSDDESFSVTEEFLCKGGDVAANWEVDEQSTMQKQAAGAKRCCLNKGVRYSDGNNWEFEKEYNELKTKYNKLRSKYVGLEQKLESLHKQVYYYKSRYKVDVGDKYKEGNSVSRSDALKFVIADMMKVEDIFMKVNQKPAASWKNFQKDIARHIWNDEAEFCQVLHEEFYELSLRFIHHTIYSLANVLKAMDLAGGTLSMEAIEVLHTLEHQGWNWFKCLLPSPAAIKIVSSQVKYFVK